MKKKSEVADILRSEQAYLKKHFGVKRIALFGSVADGTSNSNSDVDIFMEFERPMGLGFIELSDYLEKRLGRKVDILTPGGLQGIRVKRIARDIQRSLIDV